MIIIENRTVPCNPRSKNYAKGTVVNVSGAASTSTFAYTPTYDEIINTLKNGKDYITIPTILEVYGDLYSLGEVSAFGAGSGGSSGGGLIQTVYGYSSLGGTFNNATLTDTFNAYTINQLHLRLSQVESVASINVAVSGAGNAITGVTKNGNVLEFTKGLTFSLASHTHDYIPLSQKGTANGVASLDANGLIISAQLPSYVDDVIEVSTYANLPVSGESGKIYVTTDTNITYRWTGTIYVEISKSIALGETSSTAYRGDLGVIAYAHSQIAGGIGVHVSSTERTNWNLAYTNSHTHTNKSVLDGITSALISNWDTAYTNSHTHANKSLLDAFSQSDNDVLNHLSIVDGKLKVDIDFYSTGEVSAFGAGSGGSSGGGIIQTVYGISGLSATYSDANLTETFNAAAIKKIYEDVVNLQNGSLINYSLTGTGNAITGVTKSGNSLNFVKGSTFSVTGHTHNFGDISGLPTTLSGYGITDGVTTTVFNTLVNDFSTHVNSDVHLTATQKNILAHLQIVNGKLQADIDFYSTGEISAFGAGSGGSSGGGLIQTVYGYSSLGGTFNNATLTDTFNAYTINQLHLRLSQVESGAAVGFTVSGTGNAITGVTKNGNVLEFTKGLTFSLDGHTHANKSLLDDFSQSDNDVLNHLSIVEGKLKVDIDLYSLGEVSAFGAGSGTGGSGLIQTVYGLSGLGGTYSNSTLTDTFNAYAINSLHDRINNLESGSALTFTTVGSGNAVTSITKSGTSVTVTKGLNFSVDGHMHTFASLTDKPTTLSGYGITDAYTTSSADNTFFKLAGGTLTGQLTLSIAGLRADNFIKFKNDTQNCYFGIRNPYGSYGLTFASPDGTYNTVWHSGNDGAGSGLDADLWRGYAPSNINVASATKLQTARTIWGQSFNGEGGVSGAMTGVSTISATGTIYTNVGVKSRNICIETDNNGNASTANSEINNFNAILYLQHKTSNNLVMCTGGGNVLIGTTTDSGYKLDVNGTLRATGWFRSTGVTGWVNDTYGGGIYQGDSTYVKVYNNKAFWVNNNIVATGEITAFGASDIRLKSNIKQIDSALDFLGKVKTYEFDWNEKAIELNPLKTKKGAGVIAQEMNLLDNNFVHSIYGDYLGVDYERFIPYLIGGVNEVADEVTILKKKVAELELEVKRLIA